VSDLKGRAASGGILLAADGTAGHVCPALALAAAYRSQRPGTRVVFLGTTSGFAHRLVPVRGFRFEVVRASPVHGVRGAAKLRAIAEMFAGARRVRAILAAHEIELVIGFGGYASAGGVLAAKRAGLRTAILECNAAPGLANRWLGRLVDRVYLGFAGAAAAFPPGRSRCLGVPVRPEIAALRGAARKAPHGRPTRLLIVGGSQGSPFLNRRVPDLIRDLSRRGLRLQVRHQTGEGDAESLRRTYERLGLAAGVDPYIDEMDAAYRWADLAIAAAGAGTLAELAVVGLPVLIVPLDGAARNHQVENARAFAAETGAWWVTESRWDGDSIAARLADLLRDPEALSELSHKMRRLADPDVADRMVTDCEANLLGPAR
jgi:UDP-N-acetylglucosamine--N-acetylmuramyl-(pentapeptide) pyrophosphoryl-undecaprenol N-acetylglucosamine transferase